MTEADTGENRPPTDATSAEPPSDATNSFWDTGTASVSPSQNELASDATTLSDETVHESVRDLLVGPNRDGPSVVPNTVVAAPASGAIPTLAPSEPVIAPPTPSEPPLDPDRSDKKIGHGYFDSAAADEPEKAAKRQNPVGLVTQRLRRRSKTAPVDETIAPGETPDVREAQSAGLGGIGAITTPLDPSDERADPDDESDDSRKKMLALGAAIGAVVLIAGGYFAFAGGDDEAGEEGATTVATTTTQPDAAPAAERAPGVTIAFTATGAVLTGPVQSEEVKQQVLGGAIILFQNGLVDGSGLRVEGGAPPINPNEDQLLRCLGEPVLQGVGAIGVTLERTTTPGIIVVGGTVATEVAKDRIVGAVASVAGGLDRVIVEITVANPGGATTTVVAPSQPLPTDASGTAAPPTTPGGTIPTVPGGENTDVQVALDQLLQTKRIEFPSGSSELTAQWVATVDEVAADLADNDAKLLIAGHTDNVGDPGENLRLSVARAESIKFALIARGVDASRLTTTGYGATVPIEDNNVEAGRQRNRRIEFIVAAR